MCIRDSINLGTVFNDLGQLDEAIISYQKALKIKPEYAGVHFNLHSVLLGSGDMEASMMHIKKAVDIEPSNTHYRFFLGLLLDYLGKSAEAEPHLDLAKKGTSLDRANIDAWHYI